MHKEVADYIAAFLDCSQNKTSNRPPGGLLQLLPMPQSPGCDMSMDNVTGLPISEGNPVMLTVVERF